MHIKDYGMESTPTESPLKQRGHRQQAQEPVAVQAPETLRQRRCCRRQEDLMPPAENEPLPPQLPDEGRIGNVPVAGPHAHFPVPPASPSEIHSAASSPPPSPIYCPRALGYPNVFNRLDA
jgi:hypothetical protein